MIFESLPNDPSNIWSLQLTPWHQMSREVRSVDLSASCQCKHGLLNDICLFPFLYSTKGIYRLVGGFSLLFFIYILLLTTVLIHQFHIYVFLVDAYHNYLILQDLYFVTKHCYLDNTYLRLSVPVSDINPSTTTVLLPSTSTGG